MKLDLTSTRINKVIDRKELAFKIVEAATPSRNDVRREIAVLMRTDLQNVYVQSLETKTGSRLVIGTAHVYDSEKAALAIEPKHIISRNKGKEEPILDKTSETPNSTAEEKK
jgi:ribosomal protein S24E